MVSVTVIFGTESGNAEMVADDIADAVRGTGRECEIIPMEDYEVGKLATAGTVFMITSTYGDGELPETSAPFSTAVKALKPDLSGLRFAAFGLGDSTYETYNNGVDVLSTQLRALGATQIGETGRHDAASGAAATDVAVAWTEKILADI